MRRSRFIISLMLVITLGVTSVHATENWMSTTFQYEHVFNTALQSDNGSDSLGFDIAWYSLMDNGFAGFFARSGFMFSVEPKGSADNMVFRINLLAGPVFRLEINRVLDWYIGVGPSLSQAALLGKPSVSEMLLGVGVDTGLRISPVLENTSGFYFTVGLVGSVNFLHSSKGVISNRITGQVIPYVGFCFSYMTKPYNNYYVYNPLTM